MCQVITSKWIDSSEFSLATDMSGCWLPKDSVCTPWPHEIYYFKILDHTWDILANTECMLLHETLGIHSSAGINSTWRIIAISRILCAVPPVVLFPCLQWFNFLHLCSLLWFHLLSVMAFDSKDASERTEGHQCFAAIIWCLKSGHEKESCKNSCQCPKSLCHLSVIWSDYSALMLFCGSPHFLIKPSFYHIAPEPSSWSDRCVFPCIWCGISDAVWKSLFNLGCQCHRRRAI